MSGGFCPSCGAAATAGARFCAACGKPLPQAQPAPAPASAPSPTAPTARAAVPGGPETTVLEFKPLVVRTIFELLASIVTLGIGWICLWVSRWGRRYVVTTQRIECREGLATVRRTSLDLFRVEDFEVIEPFFLRLRGAGNLRIWSMDKSEPEFLLEAVPDVQGVYETLRELTRAERGRNQVRVVEGM